MVRFDAALGDAAIEQVLAPGVSQCFDLLEELENRNGRVLRPAPSPPNVRQSLSFYSPARPKT